jgi:Got1/Sft2-like family
MFGEEKQSANPLGKFGKNAQSLVFPEEPACARCMPNMTYKQRLGGFVGCFGLGWILSMIGTFTLIGGPSEDNIRAFIALYICGNIVALCATGFLLGPRRQCAKMWHPTRRYSTAFFLSMLIIVFAVAVAVRLLFAFHRLSFVRQGKLTLHHTTPYTAFPTQPGTTRRSRALSPRN